MEQIVSVGDPVDACVNHLIQPSHGSYNIEIVAGNAFISSEWYRWRDDMWQMFKKHQRTHIKKFNKRKKQKRAYCK